MHRGGSDEAPIVQEQQLPLEEALVEAGVVGDEERIAREGEEAAEDARGRRRAPQLLLAQAGEARDGIRERHARIDERLKGVDGLERPDAHRAELADPVAVLAESPVVSRSKTTSSASSSSGSVCPPVRETVAPAQRSRLSPAVTSSSSEQASPSEIEDVAKSDRAASTAVRGPRSSSVSTSRSRASRASCTQQMKANICSYFKPWAANRAAAASPARGDGRGERPG